jgi:hypothetical protein
MRKAMWKTVLIWSLVAAVVMLIFPIKFLGVWLSMIIFPFLAVRRLNLQDRENPLVAGFGYGALTGALARFFLAVAYLIIGVFAVGTADATTDTGLALGLAGSFTALSGLIGLFTGPIVGAIVGGLSGMVAVATLPKKRE